MKLLNIFSLTMLLVILNVAYATSAEIPAKFIEGKQYTTLPAKSQTKFTPVPGKVVVMEFFSYGCPGCYNTEPAIETWLKTKPKNVLFSRVPVVFQPKWINFAKAYYTAQALGIEEKITPAIFNAIHKKNLDLTNRNSMEKFFIKQGISKDDFESAFDFSPGIDAELMRGREMMRNYQVYRIPTIIINGKYKTDPRSAGGLDDLVKLMDYLIQKEMAQG